MFKEIPSLIETPVVKGLINKYDTIGFDVLRSTIINNGPIIETVPYSEGMLVNPTKRIFLQIPGTSFDILLYPSVMGLMVVATPSNKLGKIMYAKGMGNYLTSMGIHGQMVDFLKENYDMSIMPPDVLFEVIKNHPDRIQSKFDVFESRLDYWWNLYDEAYAKCPHDGRNHRDLVSGLAGDIETAFKLTATDRYPQ